MSEGKPVKDWLKSLRGAGLVFLLACGAVLLHGYHFGVGDHFHYLPAVRKALDPALYPHDAPFFVPYTRWMLFDNLVVGSIRLTRLPIDWAFLIWHLASHFLLLLGCRAVGRRLFQDSAAQWGAVVLVAVLLGLVAGGTLLPLAETYLVPRTPATALLLFALADLLNRRPRAIAWIVLAAAVHPTMALAGGFHLLIVAAPAWPVAAFGSLLPPGDLPAAEAWREVLELRQFIFPLRWPPVVWVAALAPLACLWWFGRLARRRGLPGVESLCRRLLLSGAAGIILATLITVVPGFERAVAAEPMRVLHFLYLLTVLLGGGLLGGLVLRHHRARWALVLVPLCLGAFVTQRVVYSASPHIEWPGRAVQNDWVEAFDWVRGNTPRDALFALDPNYTSRPDVDGHSFRALAARSQLADWRNDRMSAAAFPEVAPLWLAQMRDLEGWRKFRAEDFLKLRRKYGVAWVVLERPGVLGLSCPYRNESVLVCRLDASSAPLRSAN